MSRDMINPAAATSTPTTPGHVLAPGDLLAAATSMDAVTLYVNDIDAMVDFYTRALALEVIDHAGNESAAADRRDGIVTIGRAGVPLVVLRHAPDLPPRARSSAGLFHTAILFETQAALAATLLRVAEVAPELYTGSGDHLVSEAFYLDDPEGNGIELYVDRPREEWTWTDGRVAMDTLALDPNAFIRDHLTEEAVAAPQTQNAVVGHVHLQVGDIPSARAFYVDTVGFEVTTEMPSALFVSAGGYHHHMAMNTWGSMGAGPRAVTLGLGEVSIVVPTADDVAALTDRLASHTIPTAHDGAALTFTDPWKNRIAVSVG